MDIGEYVKKIQQIREEGTDPARLTGHLSELHTDYETVTASVVTKDKKIADLEKANEELRKCNLDLFLKIGNKVPEPKPPENSGGGDKKRSFKDLFDEKGKLK